MGAENKTKGPVQARVRLDDATAKGVYANASFVFHNEVEFVLDFAFLEPGGKKGQVVSRVITHPRGAKQLAQALSALVDNYERRFGPIPLPVSGPRNPEDYN